MSHLDKFAKIRPFVKLNIPHNKKKFTPKEKEIITKYYNRLENAGYFNIEREGYVLKDISRSKYKIRGAPKLKKTLVNVGTKLENGKFVTDTNYNIRIINGQIKVKRGKAPYKRIVQYDIAREWTLNEFTAHLRKRIGKVGKNNIFVTGAGDIYEMSSPDMQAQGKDGIDLLAENILAMSNKYVQAYYDFERDSLPEDFMFNLIVYENEKARELSFNEQPKKKRKRRTRRQRIRMK